MRILRALLIIGAIFCATGGVRGVSAERRTPEGASSSCRRIVSLAPSITEVVYALGQGERLVGVTRFCRYPDTAQTIQKVGGFLDINPEVVFGLSPTVVFALRESPVAIEVLQRLGIRVVTVNHDTIAGIKESVRRIGDECGEKVAAQQQLEALEMRERKVQSALLHLPQLRAMIVVGRSREGETTSGIYISGKDGFYSEVLAQLGLVNVNTRQTVAIPTISAEGVTALDPDLILEIVNVDDELEEDDLMKYWRQFHSVKAIQNNRVYFFKEDFASIPGPRYIQFLELLAHTLFPERFKSAS